jgi:hypothetical protein
MTKSTCREQIEQFLQRNLWHWTGLDAGCRKSDVTTWLPFQEGEGVVRLGTRKVEYTFRALQHRGFTEGVFFYFDRDTLSAIATEYWSFDRDTCAALLEQQGEPPHRLDFYWRDQKVDNGESVYPERGITVGVVPESGVIAKVMVYPSCSLETYRERYYETELARELRERP